MFYLRLNKVRILNNRELLGKAEVQLMSFVTSGDSDFPMLDDFYKTNDDAKKKELVGQAVTKVVSSRIMPTMQKIKDNQVIYFGDTGYNVFVSKTIPDDLNWMLIAVELDKKTRDNAQLLSEILTDGTIGKVVTALSQLASLTNPVATAITTISTFVAESTLNILKEDKDDQIGLLLTSFDKPEHYPNGKRDAQNVPDSTGNMFVDYTIFGFND